MRVISGKFKGKRLLAPNDDIVRPTTDRIKESIFNILVNKCSLEDKQVLDLFCGSGALGIEALSRGGVRGVFIDSSSESIRLARQNIKDMGKINIHSTYSNFPAMNNNASFSLNGVTIKDDKESNNYSQNYVNDYPVAELFNTNFEVAIKKLSGQKFDIIFIDPPYFKNLGEKSISLIIKYDILAQNGIIVYEHFGKIGLSIDLKRFIIDERSFGSVAVAFLTNIADN